MKKKLFLISALLIFVFQLNAQTLFYYYNGQQVSLTVDKSVVNIITNNSAASNTVLQNSGITYSDSVISQTIKKIKFASTLSVNQYIDSTCNVIKNKRRRFKM